MRMTGKGSVLGSFYRNGGGGLQYNVNGGSTMVRAGYTGTVAAPISAPSVPTAVPQAPAAISVTTPVPAVNKIEAVTMIPQRGGITVGPTGLQQAAPVIRPGPGATPGAASPATTVYGAGSDYYGAPDAAANGAPVAAKPAPAIFPFALILWTLFGAG